VAKLAPFFLNVRYAYYYDCFINSTVVQYVAHAQRCFTYDRAESTIIGRTGTLDRYTVLLYCTTGEGPISYRLLKVFQFPVAQYYQTAAFLTNVHNTLYSGEPGAYFQCNIPSEGALTLAEYIDLVLLEAYTMDDDSA